MSKANKKAYLISCSDHYGHRLWAMDKVLKQKGYETVYITSDFNHDTKEVFTCNVKNCVQVHAKPYKKNLSLDRILSHMFFSRDVFSYIEKGEEPDLIYALVPPNFIAYYGAKYKKSHPKVKIIFDIFDMWPETFPGGKIKALLAPVFKVWAWIRDKSLSTADFITCECDMFRELLKLPENKSETVYLCKMPLENKAPVSLDKEKIKLCYLGAINNIISIPDICTLLKELSSKKKVELHIIGKGEREQEFIDGARAAGAEVIYHGPIFDNDKKQEIISQCHFGLNIMKESVCIGLTMKSVDYFCHGLPIINNIPADTARLVNDKGIGLVLDKNCADKLLMLTEEECLNMRKNVDRVFNTYFRKDVVFDQMSLVLDKIC